ncbi:MAG: hypothetical protein Q7U82_10940 [Gammaproteobacteria bacterium]|nr:hypothetical protein [Gammaproteobacteria bacterium]
MYRMLRLFCCLCVMCTDLLAAEDALAGSPDLRSEIELLYLQADMVVSGQFLEISSYADQDDIGQPIDLVELKLLPSHIYKESQSPVQDVLVTVLSDNLPYKDWMMSRGAVRELRMSARSERQRELSERLRQLEAMHEQGLITSSEFSDYSESIKGSINETIDRTLVVRLPRVGSHSATPLSSKVVTFFPGERYLLFLWKNPQNSSSPQNFNVGYLYEGVFWGTEAATVEGIIRSLNGTP